MYNDTKIETDNPILDTIVYYGKKLMMGCILKDEEEAGKYESLDSARTSSMYILCMRGMASYNMFNYSKEQLKEVGINTNVEYTSPWEIPEEYHQALLKIAVRDFIANYEETNDYYRKFSGLPPMDEEGIKINKKIIGVNTNKYLHTMSLEELNLLEALGELDECRKLYPDKEYLKYLGSNRIDPYNIRTLPKFGVIYLPSVEEDIRSRYMEKLEKNRAYALTCMYSDAMRYGNDYYDKFIMLFIKLQSFVDLVMDIPDMINRKDVFDLLSVKYLLESNGITYFEEIPLKFQKAMLKNLNKLLTFKSTTKNMIDICSLFGFDNVKLFKYYLLRDRSVDKNGELKFDKTTELNIETGEYEEVEDYVNNFELKFLKVPISEIADNYIRNEDNYIPYEDMTRDDKLWTGGRDADDVYKEIIQKEFNIERSKYLSIDVVYEMDKLSFELSYFFNIIFDDVYLEENLYLNIYKISNNAIKLKDAIMYLYLLGYEQSGLEDNIIFDSPSKILSVQGFNFQVDLTKLAKYLMDHHVTLDDLGLENFTIPTNQIMTYNQLIQVYINNKKAYDHIVKMMATADDADIYHIYKDIYEALMITNISDKIFMLPTGEPAKTYTEYFIYNNIDIYKHISNIRLLDKAERENAIADTIIQILSSLEDYIDTKEFNFLFMNLPIAGNIIKQYIYKVINFFKSFRVQLDKINSIYRFDDDLENRITCIDTMRMTVKFPLITNADEIEVMMNIDEITKFDDNYLRDEIEIGWGLDFEDPEDSVGIQKDGIGYITSYLETDDFMTFMYSIDTKINNKITLNDKYIPEDMIHISVVNS